MYYLLVFALVFASRTKIFHWLFENVKIFDVNDKSQTSHVNPILAFTLLTVDPYWVPYWVHMNISFASIDYVTLPTFILVSWYSTFFWMLEIDIWFDSWFDDKLLLYQLFLFLYTPTCSLEALQVLELLHIWASWKQINNSINIFQFNEFLIKFSS